MPTHDIRAQALDTPVSAQKARLIVDMVRGKDVVQALTMLKFMPNYAAKPVSSYWLQLSLTQRKTLALAGMISSFIEFLLMKPPLANGAVLAHVVDLCPGYDAHLT